MTEVRKSGLGCPLRYPEHFEPDAGLKVKLDKIHADAVAGKKSWGFTGPGKCGKTAFNTAVQTEISEARLVASGEEGDLAPGVYIGNDKDCLFPKITPKDRLDVYGIQLDDPIRLHTWSIEDFLAFGNIVSAGQSVTRLYFSISCFYTFLSG